MQEWRYGFIYFEHAALCNELTTTNPEKEAWGIQWIPAPV
jgi:hypothetical protein